MPSRGRSKLKTAPIANEPGRRELNKVATRLKILGVAHRLFLTKGLDATSMRDLIKASELGNGTFYNYFKRKEDIFDVLVELLIGELRAQMRSTWRRHGLGIRGAKHAYKEFFNYFVRQPDALQFMSANMTYFRGANVRKKFEGMRRDIEFSLRLGNRRLEKADPALKFASMVIFGTCFEIVYEMTQNPAFDGRQAAETLTHFVQGGVMHMQKVQNRLQSRFT